MKLKCLALSILLVFACGQKKSNEKSSSISITGQKFENAQAKELNDNGVEKARNEEYDSAEDLFFEALELEPNNPTILSNIGLCYQSQGLDRKAIEYHKKSLSVSDSTYLISGVNLGNAYYQIGKYSKGIEILNYVIENSTENSLLKTAYVNRGFNHLKMGKCKVAMSDLKLAKSLLINEKDVDFQIERLETKLKNCVQQRL